MKNNWLGKVLGESSQPAPAKPVAKAVRQVLGEEAPPSEDPAPSNAAAEPAAEIHDEPPLEPEVETGGEDRVNDPVQTLVSLWTSGAKMDVAVKLLSEPISNRDFVQLALSIGNEGALELGQILDDMQAGAEEGGEGAEDAVLSRVADIRGQRAKSPEQEEAEDFRERHAEGDVHAINQAEQ